MNLICNAIAVIFLTMLQRLDKVLSDANVASRKDLKILIKRGHVKVNEVEITRPETKVDPSDDIRIDDEKVQTLHTVVLLMNKPQGYVTSTEDPRDITVIELLDQQYRDMGVVPAGRLDKDTEGLLVFTNDGNLIHNLISPKANVRKKILCRV